MNSKKQVALIILDGWGYSESKEDNAIFEAKTPFFDYLWKEYPHTLLNASNSEVGLPLGTMGNSEIGHMTMGAGRVIHTDLVRINEAIVTGDFRTNSSFSKLFEHIKTNNSTLHILGLLSPIGVHSHQEHLHEFLKLAKENNVEKIAIHAFTDGRDSPPQESYKYLKNLENILSELNLGHIATVTGRYYAMDRDKNWQRTDLAVDALFEAKSENYHQEKPSEVVANLHKNGLLDEYLEPVVFLDSNGKSYKVEDNDGIFFFNFRTDRPRQLCYRCMDRLKEGKNKNIFLLTMTEYASDIESTVAFPPISMTNTLSEVISKVGLSQVHIAETEKYAHVTYFFNGGKNDIRIGEERILIESRKDVKTHDMAPEMKAREIADAAIVYIHKGTNFLVINFANADMVGHTANKDAIIKAVETIDKELKRVVEALKKVGGIAFITADHGNAEINIDPVSGEKHTSHTFSKVPTILTEKALVLDKGSLADIAPTILMLFDLPIPKEMTKKGLLI